MINPYAAQLAQNHEFQAVQPFDQAIKPHVLVNNTVLRSHFHQAARISAPALPTPVRRWWLKPGKPPSHWLVRSILRGALSRIRSHSAHAHMHSPTRTFSVWRHDKTGIVLSIDVMDFYNHSNYSCEASVPFSSQTNPLSTINHGQRRIQTPNSIPPHFQSPPARSSSIRQQRKQRLGRQGCQSVRQRW